jgi:uncharacterized repeat protein (TIGR03803 family)
MIKRFQTPLLAISFALLTYALRAQSGVIITNVVSFDSTNGANPRAALVPGLDGNYYGTTSAGGPDSGTNGTVFRLTPNGVLNTLVSFNNDNGSDPEASLILGKDGNFYGTTQHGGTNGGWGTVFRMSSTGALTTLVSFNGTNGAFPRAELAIGSDGNFYGTTSYGGLGFAGTNYSGNGTVFRLSTNGLFNTVGLFNFTNGAYPVAGLLSAPDGSFYGTTAGGGTNNLANHGDGTVFQITTNGALKSLISFNFTNGAIPLSALIWRPDHNLYGTTSSGGGTNAHGTIFRLTTNGILTSLVSFSGNNGSSPQGGLLLAPDGNLYGTTSNGGKDGWGTIFQLTRENTLNTLVSCNPTEGGFPVARLLLRKGGHFLGTASEGGKFGQGVLFDLTIPMPPRSEKRAK